MQRYARLPTTGPALARASRDLWFRRAAECLGDDTEIIKAHKLNMEFDKFLTRGPWLAWRELKDAPKDASELRRALFFAAKFSKGEVISDQTIYRALS